MKNDKNNLIYDETGRVMKKMKGEKDNLNKENKFKSKLNDIKVKIKDLTFLGKCFLLGVVVAITIMFLNSRLKVSDKNITVPLTLNEYYSKTANSKVTEELLLSKFKITNSKNLNFNIGEFSQYKILKTTVVENFEISYKNETISTTVEFEIESSFDARDISIYNQVINGTELIIIKVDYGKVNTDVNIISEITDFSFLTESERRSFTKKLLTEIETLYKPSDIEIKEKTLQFFKNHFFFISDKFSVGVIDANTPITKDEDVEVETTETN